MQTPRLKPIALALLWLFPLGSHAQSTLPPLKVDPRLLSPASRPAAPTTVAPGKAETGTTEEPTAGARKAEPSTASDVPSGTSRPAPAAKRVAPAPAPTPEREPVATPGQTGIPASPPVPSGVQAAPQPGQPIPPATPAIPPASRALPKSRDETAQARQAPTRQAFQPASGENRPTPDQFETPETVIIRADRIEGQQDQEVKAFGQVELYKPDEALFADQVIYSQPLDKVTADGNVRVEQRENVIEGPHLELELENSLGYMESPFYSVANARGRGDADRLTFEGKGQYRLERARFTTCPVGQDDWFLRVKDLDIDRTTEIGTARNAWIEFKGVPLLYTPWIDFPLNDQRKSGFLAPSVGTTGKSGFELTVPYYWNIAPHMDATIAPRLLSKRGLQLNGEFRYLQPSFSGTTQVEFLPNDQITDTDRYAISWQHFQSLAPRWAGALNIQRASDDNYFRDLSTRLIKTTQTHLPTEGTLMYNGDWWNFVGRMQQYQTLQDLKAPIATPYDRLPQLLVTGLRQDVYGTDIGFMAEYVDFQSAKDAAGATLPTGQRFTAYPNVSLPLSNAYAYLTPKLGVHYTSYEIQSSGVGSSVTRTLPIFSVDSKVVFERDVALRGESFLQTLEPRLYYVYIPFEDQSRIPNFDTAVADFNFAQIFSENQFTGGDRINDANQVTLALTSRLLESDTGIERLRAAIGQRLHFEEQRVTLPGGVRRTTDKSNFLAAIGGQITRSLSVDAGLQYNPNDARTERFSVGTRYQPESGKVLNVGYRFGRDSFKQVDISSQWPLTSRISGLARWNYSLMDNKLLEGLAGIEYNGGCWAVRAVFHRFATATSDSTNAFFLQLELKDFGNIGANPLTTLRQNIPGFSTSYDQQ